MQHKLYGFYSTSSTYSGTLPKCLFAFWIKFIGCLAITLLFHPKRGEAQSDEYRYNHYFPEEEALEDLRFYKNKLEKEHPNLYLYTSKKEFNQFFDSISSTITAPVNSVSFYNTITSLLPLIHDGHTLIFPAAVNSNEEKNNDLYFPLQIHWDGNRMFVTRQYSYTSTISIPAGSEISLINGVSVAFLYDIMMQRQTRDGFNLTYPQWIIEKWFPQYYSFHFGNPGYFNLTLRYPDSTPDNFTIKGVIPDSIEFFRPTMCNESPDDQNLQPGITLSIDPSLHMAILKITDFNDDTLPLYPGMDFDQIIPDNFTQMRNYNVTDLILDLRDNQGGDLQNGVLLLSYLLDQPFQMVRAYYDVDELTYYIPEARLKPAKGPLLGMNEPRDDRFTGNVFVLINGGSFSSTVSVCSALRSQNRCVFIGEETGGNPYLISSGGVFTTLPHTRTRIMIPAMQNVLPDKEKNVGHGLVPDYPIHPGLPDMIAGKDPMIEFAYSLIKK